MMGKIHGSKNSTTDRSKWPLALESPPEHGQLKPLPSLQCDQRYRIKSSAVTQEFLSLLPAFTGCHCAPHAPIGEVLITLWKSCEKARRDGLLASLCGLDACFALS